MPPAAPTGVIVTPKLSTKLTIAWTNAAVDSWDVERSANGVSGWGLRGNVAVNTYDDEGLDPTVTYYYRVKAYLAGDPSTYSSVVSGTTYPLLIAPTSLYPAVMSRSEILLTWHAATQVFNGFSVERSDDGLTGWTEIATPASSPYRDEDLATDTTYYYRVRAYRTGSIEYGAYSDVESATTASQPATPPEVRLFLLSPDTVFAARINGGPFAYPLDEIPYDTVTTGAFADVLPGMTVIFGTASGADDLGRQRVRADPSSGDGATTNLIFIGRSSLGTRDGEVELADNAYVTVLDDYRVWSKIPFFDEDVVQFKDSDIAYTDQTIESPPVANSGPGTVATIDPDTEIIAVSFDASALSFATADGATITDYLWDIGDGSFLVNMATDPDIQASFPAGFRWVALTVTDSNGKEHTARCPVLAIDPADDPTISIFEIESHHITPQGQQVGLRIRQPIPLQTYPDGTFVMLWSGEPADSDDRSHVVFVGWIQQEPVNQQAQRTGLLQDVVLNCVDVAGRLATLPGLPQIIKNEDAPANWSEMNAPNIDKYLHYLLQWHSTALDLADWTWSGTGDDYEFEGLESDGRSLYDQVEQRAQAIVPDYHLTCNRHGQLQTVVDPMLQDTGDRTATEQATITLADWSSVRYERIRSPRVHWLRGSAFKAQSTPEYELYFCESPGHAPGQGEQEITHGEQIAQSQGDLNAVTGHRYARINAPQSKFTVTFAPPDDFGIEPADMTWVRLIVGAAQRTPGSTFDRRGLVQELNIRYDHQRGGTVRTVEMTWERETVGTPAATVIPGAAAPVDDGDFWGGPVIPEIPPLFNYGLVDGVQNVVLISDDGSLFRTGDFQSSPPTWDAVFYFDLSITDPIMYSWVVDPFSPLYRGTGAEVNGWAVGRSSIWRYEDVFGVAPTATAVHTFAFDELDIADAGDRIEVWRQIGASFGRFQETETDNPWLLVISHYRDVGGHTGTWAIRSEDGGQTWSSEVQISAHYDTSDYESFTRQRPIGLYMSPKTPGLAFTAAYTATGATPTPDGFVTTDWGATWTPMSNPNILPVNWLAGSIHVPYPDNDDEDIVFHGALTYGSPIEWRLKRITGGTTIDDVSPSDSGINYGVYRGLFGVRTFDGDRSYVVAGAIGNDTDNAGLITSHDNDQFAVFTSDDGGDTWTLRYGPLNRGFFSSWGGWEVAFAGDNSNVLYIWGGTPGSSLVIGYSSDFGATVLDKEGNLGADFYDVEGSPNGAIGIAGGDAP